MLLTLRKLEGYGNASQNLKSLFLFSILVMLRLQNLQEVLYYLSIYRSFICKIYFYIYLYDLIASDDMLGFRTFTITSFYLDQQFIYNYPMSFIMFLHLYNLFFIDVFLLFSNMLFCFHQIYEWHNYIPFFYYDYKLDQKEIFRRRVIFLRILYCDFLYASF